MDGEAGAALDFAPPRAGRARGGSIRVAQILIVCGLGVALVALFGTPTAKPETVRPALLGGSGDVSMWNSRDGLPIVTMGNMVPGDGASGEVTIKNTGTAGGQFYVSAQDLESHPGPLGRKLADTLTVSVWRTAPGAPKKIFSRRLSQLTTNRVGKLKPGASATYRFDVLFTNGGIPPSPRRGDNRFQGSEASVDFVWTAQPG
jgi:hypothetical protein